MVIFVFKNITLMAKLSGLEERERGICQIILKGKQPQDFPS